MALAIGILGVLGVAFAGAHPLRAQEDPVGPQPVAQPPVLLDSVAAVVGRRVILQSELDRTVFDFINAIDPAELPRTPENVQRIMARALREQIDAAALAEGARTLGAYDARQINQFIEQEIQRVQEERVRALGSTTEFFEELRNNNQTWEQFRAAQRDRVLREFAQVQVSSATLNVRSTLLFTPKEMLEFYETNRSLFVAGARTEVEVVVVGDLETAEAAAEVWRSGMQSAEEILEAHDGILTKKYRGADAFVGPAPGETEAPERTGAAPFVIEFALSGSLGDVKIHSANENVHWVMKIPGQVPAQNRAFHERSVQQEIRESLLRKVRSNRQIKASQRARSRIRVWPRGLRNY